MWLCVKAKLLLPDPDSTFSIARPATGQIFSFEQPVNGSKTQVFWVIVCGPLIVMNENFRFLFEMEILNRIENRNGDSESD